MNQTVRRIISGNSTNSYAETVRRDHYPKITVAMLSLCICSLLANFYVLISTRFIRTRSRKSPVLYVTISQVAADTWASFIIGLGLFTNNYLPYLATKELLDNFWCMALSLEALRLGGLFTAVIHLLSLATVHYLAIANPHCFRRAKLMRTLRLTVIAMWLIPSILCFITFSNIPDQAFRSPKCRLNRWAIDIHFRLIVFVLLLFPLILVATIYGFIWRMLGKLHSLRGRQVSNREVQRKLKTVVTSVLIVATFIICWLPGSLVYLLTCDSCLYPAAKMSQSGQIVLIYVSVVINSLMILKSLVNPLIYALRIPEVKAAIWLMNQTRCGLAKNSSHFEMLLAQGQTRISTYRRNAIMHASTEMFPRPIYSALDIV